MHSSAKKISIIASTFNEFLVNSMIESSMKTLNNNGYNEEIIDIVRVPGAFEIPLMAKKIALSGDYEAIIALGVIIRGATPHFDFIAAETTSGIMTVALDNMIPIGFGVLTCDTMEQAIERSGSDTGNKGHEAALAVVGMINVLTKS
ncbi:MAG: 6,7-dimethyl-8-ribityllumazine synthase [Gammaproteobacteria bacterium]|jgi:6,7-dimethyl-8-ribityllumazine synthase|nr:6,7-dimethyl-8-ribityllumazine synthase [Gammaproteobacteria bacterium]MDG2434656.1 6,7-dimethyl-8-ribityllumazine synthase [Gammaproteobacteria bacterium]